MSMQTGRVKWFDAKKGFGFITTDAGDVFVHHSAIQCNGYKTLNEGDLVEFTAVAAPKGRKADMVRVRVLTSAAEPLKRFHD